MRLCLGTVEHDLTTRSLVAGVLGGSSSSISDRQIVGSLDTILARADQIVGEGADLVDVGGVEGRPADRIGEDEELARLVPVVEGLSARFDIPLAVSTSRARVLAECCRAGAVVGRDVSGFVDDDYLPTAAHAGATVVATHSRRPARVGDGDADRSDLVAQVRDFLAERVSRARAAGIADTRIMVDAGLDIGKSPAQSLALLRESATLADLGPPLLLDATIGRFLGILLGLDRDERRVAGHAAHALGIVRGCRIVRADDVLGARRVADVVEALLKARLAQVERGWAAVGENSA